VNSISDELQLFFHQFGLHTYKKGETIVRCGDEPQGVYFIASGFVRSYFICEKGKEFTLNILQSGQLFPAVWLMCDIKNQFFFEAMTKVTVIRAPKHLTYEFIRSNQKILLSLSRNVLFGVNNFVDRFPKLILGNSREKVASVIAYLAENFADPVQSNGEVKLRLSLSHNDIANLAGLSRETTTLELLRLSKERIISTSYRNLTVKSPERLRTFARLHPS